MLKIHNVQENHIFSEVSHYTSTHDGSQGHNALLHHASQEEVNLGGSYIETYLLSADQFKETVIVGKEDKYWTQRQIDKAVKDGTFAIDEAPRVGDLKLKGIRTLFQEIYSKHVFTVWFKKQDKQLSGAEYKRRLKSQLNEAVKVIDETARQKKGVADAAEEQIKLIQENVIMPFEEGEIRMLRGYKMEFTSRDGRYQCMDMDKDDGRGEPRPVNINTITALIYDGIKYVVK